MDTRIRMFAQPRALLVGLALAATAASGCKRSEPQPGVSGPVTINVIDAAGTLQLVQDAMEAYRTKHAGKVDKFTFTKAPAPELPGKIKAMQGAGRMDIDLVLGGTDVLAAGIEQ